MFQPISEYLSQLSSFAVVGFFLAVLYEIIRVIRLFKRQSDLLVCITDFLFLSFCGVVIFAYVMELGGGRFRWFHAGGAAFGAAVYFLTIGRLVSLASNLIVNVVRRIAAYIKKCLKRVLAFTIEYIVLPALKKLRAFTQISKVKIGKCYDFIMKKAKISFNHLKSKIKMLYNSRTPLKTTSKQEKIIIREHPHRGEKRNVVKGNVRSASSARK